MACPQVPNGSKLNSPQRISQLQPLTEGSRLACRTSAACPQVPTGSRQLTQNQTATQSSGLACRNSAACAPYTTRWSQVMLTTICFSTPIRPLASTLTTGLLPPTARMAAVPAGGGGSGSGEHSQFDIGYPGHSALSRHRHHAYPVRMCHAKIWNCASWSTGGRQAQPRVMQHSWQAGPATPYAAQLAGMHRGP